MIDVGELTRRQRGASDPTASVWVAASAGTGKTHVLTDRVLRLLLAGTEPERILCLTFTKAAAAEMANRIHERLAGWTGLSDARLSAILTELGDAAPTAQELARARTLFARVLETPGGLKVQTIHAFCEALLGRFPLEAGVAPHFAVADDRMAEELLRTARDRALVEDVARPAPLVRALAALLDEARFSELMAALVAERGRLARRLAVDAERMIARMRDALRLADGEDEESVLAAACAENAFDAPRLRRIAEAMLQGSSDDRKYGRMIGDWLAAADRAAAFDAYLPAFFTDKGPARKRLVTRQTSATCPDSEEALRVECERLAVVRERRNCARIAAATAALLRLGARILELYEAEKGRRALLDYDDLILRTRALLEESASAAWVMWKLDGGLDHILIDEAQDTNPDQWRVVQALAEEFFAGAGAREANRTVFVVGDVKQSIYSFQRADPDEFMRMRAHFAERVGAAERIWRPIELALSFRSVPAVLATVDQVFASAQAADGLLLDGAALRHYAFRQGQAGLVELWPTELPEEERAEAPWTPPVERRGVEPPVVRLASRIADRIRSWLEDGERLAATGKPIAAGDVMILAQRRLPFVPEMVRQLKRRGVEVAGVDRMALAEQIAVEDLVALGRFLLLPDDDLTLAGVLKSPLVGLDEAALFRLAWNRKQRLWRELAARRGEDAAFAAAYDFLSGLLARADFVRPFELFAELLGAGGGRRKLLARLGPEANDPIDEFLALALDYERLHAPSLQGFLHWLAAGETEVKRDPAQPRDEVRVMTVHGAKGLQAPIVFLPDTVFAPNRPPALLWGEDGETPFWLPRAEFEEPVTQALKQAAAQRARREYQRLLYVALTRARDRLYVCGWDGRRPRRADCWYEMIAGAMKETGEEVELGDGRKGWRFASRQEAPPPAAPAPRAFAEPAPPPPWLARPAPAEPVPSRPLAPSRGEDEPPVRRPLAGGALGYRRGEIVHRLLQALPELPPERRAPAATRFVARPSFGVPEDGRASLVAEVLGVLEHPDFARVFGPGSRAEAPLAGVVHGRAIAGQVDRLLVAEDEILIVDFKTRRPVPASAERSPPAYLRQMAAYRAVVAEIWPERRISCALLWTDAPRLMPLPDVLLDACAP